MPHHFERIDNKYEKKVVQFLKKKSFNIVTCNHHHSMLDILAEKCGMKYFIEVKYSKNKLNFLLNSNNIDNANFYLIVFFPDESYKIVELKEIKLGASI